MNNLYLIGFMGAGKSAVGEALALQLNVPFVDIDAEIEKKTRKSITQIFSDLGEKAFRKIEREAIQTIALQRNTVVALGGGAFLDPLNQDLIIQSGITVFLNTRFDTLMERIEQTDRPLVKTRTKHALKELYEQRLPFYKKANLTINTEGKSLQQICKEIDENIDVYRG